MPLVLFIGDPHFKENNTIETDIFTERVHKLALERQPDLICIGGDLLPDHNKHDTVPMHKAEDLVKMMREIAPTFVLVGNHDYVCNRQYLTDRHWMRAMKEWEGTHIIDKVTSFSLGCEQLVFVPYVPPGRFEEALNTLEGGWKNASCIFAHQEFEGCKMGSILSNDGDKWPLEYPQVVSGHIHSRDVLQPNVYYPGSALQHAFGESEKNIIACLTIKNRTCEWEEVDLELPRKKSVKMDIDKVEEYAPPEDSEDTFRLTVHGDNEAFQALKKTKKYKELVKKGVQIVHKVSKSEKKEHSEQREEAIASGGCFLTILMKLIAQKQNPFLNETFNMIMNGNKDFEKNVTVDK